MLTRPPFQVDIGWKKLCLIGIMNVRPFRSKMTKYDRYMEENQLLFLDSVRAGFITLLRAFRWPQGAEIIFSFPTISAMPKIAEAFGYVAVSADCGPDFHPATAADVRKLVTKKTCAVVIAPLFGCRVDMNEYRRLCDENGLVLIEDAAQAYQGHGLPLKGAAHCTLFSFGILKRATCLGGAIALFDSASLRKTCQDIQAHFPVLPIKKYYKRWALGLLGKLCTKNSLIYSTLDLLTQCFDRRLSTVLLTMARSSRASDDIESYQYRPLVANASMVAATLSFNSRAIQAADCCQQISSPNQMESTGLWPKLALSRQNKTAEQKKDGYEGVSASVRLSAIGPSETEAARQSNSQVFLQRAFFIHPSFFTPQDEHEIDYPYQQRIYALDLKANAKGRRRRGFIARLQKQATPPTDRGQHD